MLRAGFKVESLKDQFEKDGYILGVPILTADEVVAARGAYERLELQTSERSAKGRITNAHQYDEAFFKLATHPRVLEIVETLMGPDIIILSTGFFVKAPSSSDKFVAWHQDTMYWGLTPPFALTVWLAIDDADTENGCMRVIPGSHRLGLLPHGISGREGNLLGGDQEIDTVHFDESSAVDFCLNAGFASLHHGELIHGSNPNHSTRRRCGMTMRFTHPGVSPVTDGPFPFKEQPILVRGEDRFGNFQLAPLPFGDL